MKKIQVIIITLIIGAFFINSSYAQRQRTKEEKVLVSCTIPQNEKAILAVAAFEVKAPNAERKTGDAMSDMLSNALLNSGCFRVVDRTRTQQMIDEQARGLGGYLDGKTAPKVGKLLGAQILVTGIISEMAEESAVGGGGLLGTVVGGVGMMKAHVGMIIQLVDSQTGELLISKSVERKVTKVGALAGGLFGGIPLGGLGFKSKAMQDAIEEAIIDAVAFVSEQRDMIQAAGAITQSKEPMTKANCALFKNGQRLRLMVIIPEVHITRPVPDPAGETAIIKKLIAFGFDVIDPKQVRAVRTLEALNMAAKDVEKAIALGNAFDADIIIVGEAFSELAGTQGNMRSCRARVEARAIQTNTGSILATDGTHASGLDISELVAGKTALRNAGEELADIFIDQLCGKAEEAAKANTPKITNAELAVNKTDYNKLTLLANFLKALPGVSNVQKTLNGNTGRIQLSLSNGLEDLADSLLLAKLGFPIKINSFNNNKMDVTLN